MKIGLKYKGKKFEVDVKKCNLLQKTIGLMFTQRKKAQALLFDFKKPTRQAIHSWFVFFPFIAIWLDDKNKILEIKRVRPFTPIIKPKKLFNKIVEIPINEGYKKIVGVVVGHRKI